jgi:hypothetical protein
MAYAVALSFMRFMPTQLHLGLTPDTGAPVIFAPV